ncbi:MAG: 6-bladed beta-propeller [Bacteroides sp.]|nr:6-bladed beta-propeller [Bacteroides sp.]MBD5375476.1 6-bladed beta-propeller [Bacteroides sp.]
MRIISFFLILTSIILNSCKNNPCEISKPPVISVNINNVTEDASLFFDGWSYVALETTNDNVINNIDRLSMSGSNIIIASDDNIHIFTRDGKAVNSFNRKGAGPEEYLTISDMKLYNDMVWIVSISNSKIYVYNFEGQCEDVYDLPHPYHDMTFLASNEMVLSAGQSTSSQYEFVIYNLTQRCVTKKMLPYEINGSLGVWDFNPFIAASHDCVYGIQKFDYTIYRITENQSTPFLQYEFNTSERLDNLSGLSLNEKFEKTTGKAIVRYLGLAEFGEKETVQAFNMFTEGYGLNTYIYRYTQDHSKGNLLNCGVKRKDGFPFLNNFPRAFFEGNYVNALIPLQIKIIEEQIEDCSFSKSIGLTDESNPVLFFHHFRSLD